MPCINRPNRKTFLSNHCTIVNFVIDIRDELFSVKLKIQFTFDRRLYCILKTLNLSAWAFATPAFPYLDRAGICVRRKIFVSTSVGLRKKNLCNYKTRFLFVWHDTQS